MANRNWCLTPKADPTTNYIIVCRMSGELYNGNNVCRFYDKLATVQGQTNLNLYTILEVTLGRDLKIEQVAKFSRTKKEFYEGIDEELEEYERHRQYCLGELKDDPDDDWVQNLLDRDEETIADLKTVRYENLVWK